MEKKLSFSLKLSLTEIALRRVAVILWSGEDVLASIAKIQIHSLIFSRSENAQQIVESKVLKLALPEALKEQLMLVVKPIGLEIKGWKEYHGTYLDYAVKEFDARILEKLCWTAMGTVDNRKTAQVLIYYKMFNILECYKLACLYCLEDYISVLWKELPEHDKNYFYMDEDTWCIQQPFLMFCWPYILKGEEFKLDNYMSRMFGNPTSFLEFAFEDSSRRGNKVAVEYFFPKLTPEDATLIKTAQMVVKRRDTSGSDCIPLEKYSEVLCYLLSLMTPEQQMEVFKKRPCTFLRCFLDWPLQDLFLEVSDFIWNFLSPSNYNELLRNIFDGFVTSSYCFPKLFQGFFIRCPMDFRKCFVERESKYHSSLISKFARAQDSETIKVIFRNVDAEDRVKLVSSSGFYSLSDSLISDEKWHIVEVCLREARLSKEDLIKFKGETFPKFLSQRKMKQRKWIRFFQLLDRIYARAPEKGNSEVETLTKAKRHGPKK